MRLFKKIILITMLSLFGLFATVSMLVLIFEDDIKRYAVEYLNKRLNTRIEVKSIDLTIWDRFPSASLRFNNIAARDGWETGPGEDTLFYAESLYLEFDFWDIFSGSCDVEHITTHDGFFRARINREGQTNFNVFKSTDGEQDEDFTLNLQQISLKNMAVSYESEVSDEHYRFYLDDAEATGAFHSSHFTLTASSHFKVEQIRSGALNMLRGVPGHMVTSLQVDTENGRYSVTRSDLLLGRVPFVVSGEVTDDSLTTCNLHVDARGDNMSHLFSLLPAHLETEMRKYASQGSFGIQTNITGAVTSFSPPKVEASFHIDHATLSRPGMDYGLTDVAVEGSFANRNRNGKEELRITSFRGKIDEGTLTGQLVCTDFSHPRVEGEVMVQVDMARAGQLIDNDELHITAGVLRLDSRFNVLVGALEDDPEGALAGMNLEATVEGMAFESNGVQVEDLKARFLARRQHAIVKDLTAKVDGRQLEFDGAFENVIPLLFGRQKVVGIVGSVYLDELDIDHWRASLNPDRNEVKVDPSKAIGFDADVQLRTPVMKSGHFVARNLLLHVGLTDGNFRFHHMQLETAEGSMVASGTMDRKDGGYVVSMNTRFANLQIAQLFDQFNQFGQEYVTSIHASGRISGKVEFLLHLDNDMQPELPSLVAEVQMNMKEGRLKELPAFADIINELKSKKTVDIFLGRHIDDLDNRLKDVHFSQLDNTFLIANEKVLIPAMDIRSSVLDLHLSGTHWFDNHIDYAFDFLFNDLKIQEDDYTEFGKLTDDGTGMRIFVKMTGTSDNPVIQFDKNALKRSRKDRIKEEKETLKSLLKEELKLFKKDTTVKEIEQEERKAEFLIYEGDEEPEFGRDKKEKEKKEKHKKDNKGKIGRFYDKLKQEEGDDKEKATFEISK